MLEVVGVVKGVSKKTEKPFTVMHCLTEFEDFQTGALGKKVDNFYIGKNVEVVPGNEIMIEWGKGFQGLAYIQDITVLPFKK